ncbi:AAA family ATPase [Actinomadura sp. ATCC 39365]
MFVGREAELGRLTAAWARTPSAVLVVGEAGIGKTRLVGRFAGEVDALVAEGGADPGGPAYAPFVPVLRRLVREYGAGLVPGGGRKGLACLLPELGELDDTPDLGRARLFEEVLLLVERAAERRPLVIVLEDLHWADQAARDLLAYLLRNLTRPGAMVVATSREPLRLPGAEVVRVPPLGRDEVARLLGRDDVDVIVARSEGNPLFAEALAEAGDTTPASLRELLLAGAEKLPGPGLDVLRIAAVAGRRTPHEVLRQVAGLDDLALDEALRPVVRARLLLVDGDAYVFRHALIREAVYDDLLPGERRRLHARCAPAQPELAADHWHAAGDGPRAFEAAWRARDGTWCWSCGRTRTARTTPRCSRTPPGTPCATATPTAPTTWPAGRSPRSPTRCARPTCWSCASPSATCTARRAWTTCARPSGWPPASPGCSAPWPARWPGTARTTRPAPAPRRRTRWATPGRWSPWPRSPRSTATSPPPPPCTPAPGSARPTTTRCSSPTPARPTRWRPPASTPGPRRSRGAA